jgi:hypothetical protein
MFNLNDLKKITSLLSPAGFVENFKKLLGEQEVPKFKARKDKKDFHHPKPPRKDRKKNWKKNSKNVKIKIDHEKKCSVDRGEIPEDAEYKGTREVIVQNVV